MKTVQKVYTKHCIECMKIKNMPRSFQNVKNILTTFDGEPIVPKLELLKATATGRLYGYEAYSKAINYIAITYANTEEGKQAQDIEANVIPKLANKDFIKKQIVLLIIIKLFLSFKTQSQIRFQVLQKTLDEVLKNVKYYTLNIFGRCV